MYVSFDPWQTYTLHMEHVCPIQWDFRRSLHMFIIIKIIKSNLKVTIHVHNTCIRGNCFSYPAGYYPCGCWQTLLCCCATYFACD